MRRFTIFVLLQFVVVYSFGQKLSQLPIIPRVQQVRDYKAPSFEFNSNIVIYISSHEPQLKQLEEYLEQFLNEFNICTKADSKGKAIFLTVNKVYNPTIGAEGYVLHITKDTIDIIANTTTGIFYGIQTLKQLVLFSSNLKSKFISLPSGEIIDYPVYSYRGMMLDVSRHFFSVEDIEKLIDYLSLFKINHLHLHLSDDQGWRIEIKAYPELTRIGGKTQVGGGKAGYYTQKQFKQIVKYAKQRGIEIVPEIDMPGHINAALASYAFLSCDGKRRALYTGTKVGFSSLCTSKDTVYKFVRTVIREISELYPGEYFHIGGDESMATPHKEYLRFIDSVQKIVADAGKKMIGWDEISQTKLDSNTVVQFWIHKKFAQKAANEGHKIIISYAPYCYMDMKYNDSTPLGLRWAGYLNLYKSYNWTPDTLLKIPPRQILGLEAPLWTETVKNLDDIEFMTFPRICSYAEIGWTVKEKRNWTDFKERLAYFSKIFKRLNINYYRSPYINWR